MRTLFPILLIASIPWALFAAEEAIDPERAANTVILDKTAVQNLNVKTVFVSEEQFESTVFAIGRIEEIPANHSVLSSRIAGRVFEVNAFVGDTVKQDEVIVRLESRQPGNPATLPRSST
ncbi:MAG: hypothetical protein CMO55_22500 [Verrucomicrobiales bacterium]|nr:hypothetical protein [Verrucomicrobiales bacterium]